MPTRNPSAPRLCPRCHRPLDAGRSPPEPVFDDENFLLRVDGSVLRLVTFGAVEWSVLTEMRKHLGDFVSAATLLDAINRGRADPTTPNCLAVTIGKIRHKLSATPWTIRGVKGRGYVMERAP